MGRALLRILSCVEMRSACSLFRGWASHHTITEFIADKCRKLVKLQKRLSRKGHIYFKTEKEEKQIAPVILHHVHDNTPLHSNPVVRHRHPREGRPRFSGT